MFAGNVLGPTVFYMDCLLNVNFTLELFIESFVQKFNDSGPRQLKGTGSIRLFGTGAHP